MLAADGGHRNDKSTPDPERFDDIVQRLFPRLKEPHVSQSTAIETERLPSADDHYRTMCRLLTEADGHRHNLAEVHALVERVAGHRHAGELALKLWPATESDAVLELRAWRQAYATAEQAYAELTAKATGTDGDDATAALAHGAFAYRIQLWTTLDELGVKP